MKKIFYLLVLSLTLFLVYYFKEKQYNDKGISKKFILSKMRELDQCTKDIAKSIMLVRTSYSQRAHLKLELFDYRGALDDFHKALKIEAEIKSQHIEDYNQKKVAEYYFQIGRIKLIMNDFQAAIEVLNKTIELKSEIDVVRHLDYCIRGYAKFNIEDYEGALEDYNKAIQIEPKNRRAYQFRGILKNECGDYNGAISDFNFYLKQSEASKYDNDLIYFFRGYSRDLLGDSLGAIHDYSKAIEIKAKKSTFSFYNYNQIFNRYVEHITESNDDYIKRMIRDGKHQLIYYLYRGNALGESNEPKKAISDYNKALKIYPKFALALYKRGLLKLKLGQKENGIFDLYKAGEFGYSDAYLEINK